MVGRLKSFARRALRAVPGLCLGVAIGVAWLAAQQDNMQRLWLAVAAAYLFFFLVVLDVAIPNRRGQAKKRGEQ